MNGTRNPISSRRTSLFWPKVDRSAGPDACWPWTGSLNDSGYGVFWDGARTMRAHRFALLVDGRTLTPGMVVDHDCHNHSGCTEVPCSHRRCCNPSHLIERTQSENSIEGRSGDHQSLKTACPAGHPYDELNTKITRSRNRRPRRTCRKCNKLAQQRYNEKRSA